MQTNHESPPKRSYNFRALWSLFLIAGLIFISDQIVKTIAVSNLAIGESWAPVPALERVFKFTHITHTGAAFGLFQNSGIVFIVVALVVSGVIIYYYPSVNNWTVRISLALQLGGAISNVWDRIFNGGEVVDYVDIGFWPIFNIADLAIVTGVGMLAFWLWQVEEKRPQAKA